MLYPLIAFLVVSVNLLLGVAVFSVNPSKIQNRLFAVLTVLFAGWTFGALLIALTPDYSMALFLGKLVFLPVAFIAPVYLHFVLSFYRSFVPLLIYLPAFVFCGLSLFTDLLVTGLHRSSGNFLYCAGCFDNLILAGAFPFFALYSLIVIFSGFLGSFRMLSVLKGAARARMKLLVIGTAIPIFIGSVTDVVFPIYGIYGYGIAQYLTVVSALFFFYAFFKFKETE